MGLILKNRFLQILILFLIAQGAGLWLLESRQERLPSMEPLTVLPHQIGPWRMTEEHLTEKEVQEVLRADDSITRVYVNSSGSTASLFIAYFRSQRTGVAPHSPKNCMPGAGWTAVRDEKLRVDVPGRSSAIEVNHYVIERGDLRSVVLYWYQSRNRVVASEYEAKFFVVYDAIRENRTDSSLVRVIVPVTNNATAKALEDAKDFVGAAFPPLRRHLPS